MEHVSLNAGKKPIQILFLAWGFSIHAKRRIQIFVDDPRFEVTIVSNYDYNFSNARNIILTGINLRKKQTFPRNNTNKLSFANIIKRKLPFFFNTFFLFISFLQEIQTSFRDVITLRDTVKKVNPEIIFLQTLLYPCYLAYLLPKSIPIIITFWNGDIIWWAKWKGIERLLKKQIVTYGVRRAKAITVNSKMAYDACVQYGKNPQDINLIIYPGVDLSLFHPYPKVKAREALGITSNHVVLWPRGLGGYLNSEVFVEASRAILIQHPNTLFIVLSDVGGEEELLRHQKLASDMGVEKNFIWMRQVKFEDMPLYYACSDVMVSISSKDSLPNVMLEAMACGTPVVMGDIPQIREWIKDGINGYLVPLRDSTALSEVIIQIFNNPDGIKEICQNNIQIAETDFNSRKNCEKIKDLICTIVES